MIIFAQRDKKSNNVFTVIERSNAKKAPQTLDQESLWGASFIDSRLVVELIQELFYKVIGKIGNNA